MSSLLWVDDSHFGEALLFLVFPVICYFHQIVMISVLKLCRVVDLADLHGVNVFSDYSWFLSKNENNNGFDSIGLNSFLFECRRAVYFPFCRCTLHCFPWLLALDWMRYLRIEHHLAAKFGTFFALLI